MTDALEQRPQARLATRIAAWFLLGVLNLAGALAVFFAWGVLRLDPHDRDAPAAAAIVVFGALVITALTALVTVVGVKTRAVGRRWFVAPAVVSVAGLIVCCGADAIQ